MSSLRCRRFLACRSRSCRCGVVPSDAPTAIAACVSVRRTVLCARLAPAAPHSEVLGSCCRSVLIEVHRSPSGLGRRYLLVRSRS